MRAHSHWTPLVNCFLRWCVENSLHCECFVSWRSITLKARNMIPDTGRKNILVIYFKTINTKRTKKKSPYWNAQVWEFCTLHHWEKIVLKVFRIRTTVFFFSLKQKSITSSRLWFERQVSIQSSVIVNWLQCSIFFKRLSDMFHQVTKFNIFNYGTHERGTFLRKHCCGNIVSRTFPCLRVHWQQFTEVHSPQVQRSKIRWNTFD